MTDSPAESSLVQQQDTTARLAKIVALSLVALCMYSVVTRLWACEDAYISFRYIDNWLHGYGLVYNIGERVEGFTHPLWLFLVTLPTALGLAERASALWLSLLITLVTALLVAFSDRDSEGRGLIFPLALLIFVTNSGWRDFSVSGLEFPLACLLLVLFYINYKRHGLFERPYFSGALLALIYLTRPELVLLAISFYAIEVVRGVILLVRHRSDRFRQWLGCMVKMSLPIVLLAGGYHLFRWLYYGEFFPNTYYAKAGLGTYWSQGWVYLADFWRYSPLLSACVLAGIVVLPFCKSWRHAWLRDGRRLVMFAQIVMLILYVTRLGGDFMAFRFHLPALVILAILLNDLPNYLFGRRVLAMAASLGLLALAAFFTFLPTHVPQREGFIADERQYYDLWHPAYRALFEEPVEHKWYQKGILLKQLQEDTDYPLALATGNIGYLGYAAGPLVRIVDVYGLTDYDVARNWKIIPKGWRGRPGHEVKLSLELAVEKHVSIWSTPFDDWNEVMSTAVGPIITIDPAFLHFFPDKIKPLKELKAYHLEHSPPNSDIRFFIALLEKVDGVRIEDLED